MNENLPSVVNDAARRIKVKGHGVRVPLKFDASGAPATSVDRLIFKRLSMDDLRFLKYLREAEWNVDLAVEKTGISLGEGERLVKKLACFREEDARVKALCEIPTTSWIKSKHVENFYEGGTMADSQQKSLQELAKIEGAYKSQSAVSITQNVFNLPKLTPAVEEEFRQLAQKALDAEIVDSAA